MHPRTSIVLRPPPNYRLVAVNHAVRPPVRKNHRNKEHYPCRNVVVGSQLTIRFRWGFVRDSPNGAKWGFIVRIQMDPDVELKSIVE